VYPCVRPVYLVHYDYDPVAQLQGAAEHETRLGHRALGGINKQKDAVDHFQNPFHLAAEIGVAGSVHYVYFHIVVMNGGVLCKYGNPALSLQVAGIHDPFRNRLVFAENSALAQHLVHQRRLAVVYMGYYCYISYFH
jgi:hypothetical protein